VITAVERLNYHDVVGAVRDVLERSGPQRRHVCPVFTKVVNRITEDARVAVRGARRDGNDLLKDAQKEKEISEDDSKLGQKRIQELTDKYVAQVDKLGVAKEEEIMEV